MLLLARIHGTPIGCAALRSLGRDTGELKRVYVRPAYRGGGLGRRLVQAVVRHARRLEYSRLVLDTLPAMSTAIRMYREMGFAPIPAYWRHPVPEALFFEYRLRRTAEDRT